MSGEETAAFHLIADLRRALEAARAGGAITQAEWTAFSYVPVGQGDEAANAAVAALLDAPCSEDVAS